MSVNDEDVERLFGPIISSSRKKRHTLRQRIRNDVRLSKFHISCNVVSVRFIVVATGCCPACSHCGCIWSDGKEFYVRFHVDSEVYFRHKHTSCVEAKRFTWSCIIVSTNSSSTSSLCCLAECKNSHYCLPSY